MPTNCKTGDLVTGNYSMVATRGSTRKGDDSVSGRQRKQQREAEAEAEAKAEADAAEADAAAATAYARKRAFLFLKAQADRAAAAEAEAEAVHWNQEEKMYKYDLKIEGEHSLGVVSAFMGGFAINMICEYDNIHFKWIWPGAVYIVLLVTG